MIGRVWGLVPVAAAVALATAGPAALGAVGTPVSYSAAQAAAGEKLYAAKCSACHGDRLEGGAGPALSGADLTKYAKITKLSVGDMFTFMSQQMPLNEPASLTHDQYVAVMAYIPHYNGYKTGPKPLTYDAALNSTTHVQSMK